MWIIIEDVERGLLVQDGRVVEWLGPGRHVRLGWGSKLRVERLNLDTPYFTYRPEIERVAPADSWTELTVAPNELAVVSVDGIPQDALLPGRYMLFQERAEVTAERYDMGPLAPEIPVPMWRWVPASLGQVVTVAPYERILVYDGGALARVLETGRSMLSRLDRELKLVTMDLRIQERTITGQEVMTADKVSLRMNVLFSYRVTDPVRAVESVSTLEDALYSEAQMASRRGVAGLRLDQLLEDRRGASDRMTSEVAERAAAWGVEVLRVDVKDVVLPGEMKALLNRVIEAEKQAAAQVILRREETAATRSQANTAKMLEASPTLMRLRELEALKEIAGSIDQLTVVSGSGELFRQLLSDRASGRGGES